MESPNMGEAVTRLWCVELIPKLKPLTKADEEKIREMANGMPEDANGAIAWVVGVVAGSKDERSPDFVRERRRLVVYRNKRDAAERARKEANEFWTAMVRPVRVV